MPSFRAQKQLLLSRLSSPNWISEAYNTLEPETAKSLLNPLLAMLPRHDVQWQAAHCLGKATAFVAEKDKESGRNLMRRLMWSLNEESGNLGWGIPQTMGCIVAESPILAKEFSRILISYIIDTGKDDNYIDYAPLRSGAYWAIAHACEKKTYAEFGQFAFPHLAHGFIEDDAECRSMAVWSVGKCAASFIKESQANTGLMPDLHQLNTFRKVADMLPETGIACTFMDAMKMVTLNFEEIRETTAVILREAAVAP